MEMTQPLFIVQSTIGPFLALIGFITYRSPPKRINHFYGYRTPRSMKSQERWDLAQTFSAKELMKLGGAVTLLSSILFAYPNETVLGSLAGVTGLGVILLIVRVERTLKKRFG